MTTLLTSGVALTAQDARPTPALGGLDPVALCRGQEQLGQRDHWAEHEGQLYLFANAAQATEFARNPARWSIQLGGACARMGPLSGRGDPQRHLVHDGRIYIFASEPCRSGFAKDPLACLDREEPSPRSGKNYRDGSAWIARARTAHGLDRFRAFSFVTIDKSDETLVERRYRIRSPQSGRVDTTYVKGDQVWKYAKVLGDDSFSVDEGTARDMTRSARREMLRSLQREPCVSLCVEHTSHVLGKRNVANREVTEVAVWIDGSLTTFGIDSDDRVRTVRFRGRGQDLRFTEIVRVYDDFERIGGQLMAHTVKTIINGSEVASLSERRGAIEVGTPVDERLFRRTR